MNEKYNQPDGHLVLLKAEQVADILNIGLSKAYQLMQSGDIPTIRIDRSVRVRPCDLDEYIQRCWSGWKD